MFARETLKFSQTIVAYEGAIVWNWKDLNSISHFKGRRTLTIPIYRPKEKLELPQITSHGVKYYFTIMMV